MKPLNFRPLRFILIFILFIFHLTGKIDAAESIEIAGGTAEVTFIEGKVTLLNKGISLNRGDRLSPGDRIETAENARVEFALLDGSFIRFGEKTTFELISASLDHEEKQRDIRIRMILGKTWANVSNWFNRRGRFELATKTAICGVRGTVYRLNVNPDDSVMVRVYWGEIVVNAKKQSDTGDAAAPPQQIRKPSKVMGPEPISGPHSVSKEEWTYIVKALQQINIRPDGTATKPFRFNIEEDLDDWVLWNQKRDEILNNSLQKTGHVPISQDAR